MGTQSEDQFTKSPKRTSASNAAGSIQRPVITFIGANVVFSDRLLDLVEEQFDDIDVINLNAVADLTQLDPALRSAVRLVIVDETALGDFDSLYAVSLRFSKSVTFALAYRTKGIAAAVHQKALTYASDWNLGFLPMNIEIESWLASLRMLVLGQIFVPSEVLTAEVSAKEDLPCSTSKANRQHSVVEEDSPAQNDLAKLTNREAQIIELISRGHRNRAIAKDLGLSVHTVKLHVHNIFGKLGVDNRTSATTKYLSQARQ